MKETKSYWYPDTAYSIVQYFICLHFPSLINRIEKRRHRTSMHFEKKKKFFLKIKIWESMIYTLRIEESPCMCAA